MGVPPTSGWDEGAAPWATTYPAGVPASYPYPGVPVGRLLDDAAQDFPDLTAVEYRRHRMTYRKLADHVDRFASALATLDVGPGDRVSLLLPNCPQLVIALFAAWRRGAAVVVHDPQDPGDVAGADPRVVVVLDRWYARTVAPAQASLRDGTPVIVTARRDYLPFPSNIWASLRGRFSRIPETEDVLWLADLIRRSHPVTGDVEDAVRGEPEVVADATAALRALLVNCFQVRLWLPDVVAGDERVLLAVPLSSLGGIVWMLATVLSAGTMILVDESRAGQRQRAAMRARPTILPFDAALAADLLRSSRLAGSLPSVRIAVSSDAVDADVATRLEQLTDKGRIRRSWGVRGVVTHADPIYGRVRRRSVGLPLPDTQVAVIDPVSGGHRPPGTDGRLWLRGPQLDGDAWVDGGCRAVLDADGYLTLEAEEGAPPTTT